MRRSNATLNTTYDLGSVSIRRDALLSSLEFSRPKLLSLIAPAGFGKSTLVRQLVAGRTGTAICDCTGVRDELDFARRIVAVLAELEPGSGSALAQTELMLADGAATSAQGVHVSLAAWRASTRSSTFVFENAEHLWAQPQARDLLTRLLGDLPEDRSVIICSREPLRVHLSRYAPPHRIVSLRADVLALRPSEVESILGPLKPSEAIVERIVALSQGWPIAVFLLARFLQEGRLTDLLERLNDVAFEDLHDYLADQVLGALDPDTANTLFASACIPNASSADLLAATGDEDAVRRFLLFERSSPFVNKTREGAFSVHPLVATMMVEREPARRDALLERTATTYESRRDYLRGAELHLARGDQEAAARVLECVTIADDHAPSMRYARILASIDRELVKGYPTLWACGSVLQMFSTGSQKLLDENTEVLRRLPADVPPQKRYFIYITRVLLLTYLGQFDAALRLVESLAPRKAVDAIPEDTLRGYALYLHGLVLARMGRLEAAERDLNAAWPLIKSMDILASAVPMILGADIERVHGRRDRERQLLEHAIEATLPSELANIVAQRLAEATFGAWLAGEDDVFAAKLTDLANIVYERGISGFVFFTDCARRGFRTQPDDNDLPKWVICGHLIAYGDLEDPAAAAVHARSALRVARTHATPYLIALAALALAEVCTGAERAELFDEARAAANALESPAFARAVQLAADGQSDVGILAPYFERRVRFRREPPAPRLQVHILRGRVLVNGTEIALTDRELALLFVLASRQQQTSRETLTDSLWPDLEESAARRALHVCLYRLRQRLGDESLIVRTASGYALCDDARVDMWDIRHTTTLIRSRGTLTEQEAQELRNLLRYLKLDEAQRLASWDWFRTIERRVQELRSEIAQRLATFALEHGRLTEALELALETIEMDTCDEPAHELAIQAYLRKGDRAAALRQFRQYRDTLRAELQCAPSARIAELVGVDRRVSTL